MKKRIGNIVFILLLGLVSATILAGVRLLTREGIVLQEERALKLAVLEAAGIEADRRDVDKVFESNITVMMPPTGVISQYYVSRAKLHIFPFTARGLWGPIEGMIAVKPDLTRVERVAIIAHEETPGLGSRIADNEFLERLRDRTFPLRLLARTQAAGVQDVEAISGATISCRAVVDAVNRAADSFRRTLKGVNDVF